jgi:hypothetical protein
MDEKVDLRESTASQLRLTLSEYFYDKFLVHPVQLALQIDLYEEEMPIPSLCVY